MAAFQTIPNSHPISKIGLAMSALLSIVSCSNEGPDDDKASLKKGPAPVEVASEQVSALSCTNNTRVGITSVILDNLFQENITGKFNAGGYSSAPISYLLSGQLKNEESVMVENGNFKTITEYEVSLTSLTEGTNNTTGTVVITAVKAVPVLLRPPVNPAPRPPCGRCDTVAVGDSSEVSSAARYSMILSTVNGPNASLSCDVLPTLPQLPPSAGIPSAP